MISADSSGGEQNLGYDSKIGSRPSLMERIVDA